MLIATYLNSLAGGNMSSLRCLFVVRRFLAHGRQSCKMAYMSFAIYGQKNARRIELYIHCSLGCPAMSR